MSEAFTIGRDPGSDIALADDSVSRLHAEIVVMDDGRVFLRDCGGVNGTHLIRRGERKRLVGTEVLADVDAVEIGDVLIDIEALREMVRAARQARDAARREVLPRKDAGVGGVLEPSGLPGQRPAADAGKPGLAEFVPLVAGFARLRERRLLLPIVAVVVLIVLLIGAQSRRDPLGFVNTLAVAVCLGSYGLVYLLCGRHKPLLAIAAVMAAEAFVMKGLFTPFAYVFRGLTGAQTLAHSGNLAAAFIGHFIAAGMMEELMKMTPALILIAAAPYLLRTRLRRWVPTEPLDVILYACAAATMFVMVETLGQYVPGLIARTFKATVAATGNEQLGALRGLLEGSQLAVIRTLNGIAGHLAYSGYMGYYIGLGLLRPDQRTRLWLGGYLGASALHGASNAANSLNSIGVLLVVKLVTVTFLVAAILNARKVSPTRSENFATVAVPPRRAPSVGA